MSPADKGHEDYLLSFEGTINVSKLNAGSNGLAVKLSSQTTRIAAKEFQVAASDIGQRPSIATDLKTSRQVQLPLGDVEDHESSSIFEAREGYCASGTHQLDDILSWIGSSDLGRDHRLLPQRLSQVHESSTNLARDRAICRNGDTNSARDRAVIRNGESDWHTTHEEKLYLEDAQQHKLHDLHEHSQWELDEPRNQEPLPQTLRQEKHRKKMEHFAGTLPVSQLRVSPHFKNEKSQACPAVCPNPRIDVDEEKEWSERQRLTGTVCRLVEYNFKDDPRQDIHFRGGMDSPLVVANVLEAGCAQRAGVKVGDRLVSINGKKDFVGLSVDELYESSLMKPPALFLFIGFVGKLQAEVRLTLEQKKSRIGIPWNHEINSVLDTSSDSLFIAVSHDELPEELFQLSQSDARVCRDYALDSLSHRCLSDFSKMHGQQLQDSTFLPHCTKDLASASGMDQISWTPSMNPRYPFRLGTPRFFRSSRQSPRVYRSGPRTCVQKRPCMDPDIFHEPVQD